MSMATSQEIKVIIHPLHYNILKLLGESEKNTVSDISRKLGIDYPALVPHLRTLLDHGFIRQDEHIYFITPKAQDTLQQLKRMI